jgi:tRNA (guanine37-N1)-methyltransferase
MKYTVLTLFPEITDAYFACSIMAKAVEKGLVAYTGVNIRDYAQDRHKTCDDAPYGGGPGMLMLPEPLTRAFEAAGVGRKGPEPREGRRVVYLSPQGRLFNQEVAREYAALDELVLVCGRYEGIDQRVIEGWIDEELCVGDYVLSSGETAALVVIDATYRLIDSVITRESLAEESFNAGLLEYPQWTRPEVFNGMTVPEVLLSGHHANIKKWRLYESVKKTLSVRPELIDKGKKQGLFNEETLKMIRRIEVDYERDSSGTGRSN